jgi:hypothetical protein
VQAVFRHAGDNICFVDEGGSARPVKVEIGLFNSMWVQVLAGLTEGQTVLMSPPPDFQLQADRPESGPTAEEPRAGEVEPQPAHPAPDDGTLLPTLPTGGPSGQPSGFPGAEGGDAARRERFQNMSEEERKALMERFQKGGGGEGRRGRRDGGGGGGDGGERRAENGEKREPGNQR